MPESVDAALVVCLIVAALVLVALSGTLWPILVFGIPLAFTIWLAAEFEKRS